MASDGWLAAVVIVLVGTVYVWTLLPGVGYDGDTAKFQFLGRVLGTPHPTGYPTYLILNHLFTRFFPWGSLAWKANLLSAVFSLAALGLLLRTLRLLEVRRVPAVGGVLALAMTPTLWTYSIVAEVYTLHLLFVAGVVHLLALWRRTRSDRWLLLACALIALSFGNHLTTVFLLPAGIFMVAATDARLFLEGRKLLAALGLGLAGALQYTYLMWRTHDPATPYLEVAAPDLMSLWGIVTGGRYKMMMFQSSLGELLLERVPMIFSRFLWEFLFALPLAFLGLLRLRDRVLTGFLVLLFAANTFWVLNYDVRDYYVFLIPSFFVTALFVALGLDHLASGAGERGGRIAASFALLIPIAFVALNGGQVSQRYNTGSARTVETVLEAVGEDAVIITPEYRISEYFWYYLIGEGMETRNIHVFYDYSLEKVRGYLEEGRPLFNPIERKTVPGGLKLYCIKSIYRESLLRAGYRLRPVIPGLDLVEAAGQATVSAS